MGRDPELASRPNSTRDRSETTRPASLKTPTLGGQHASPTDESAVVSSRTPASDAAGCASRPEHYQPALWVDRDEPGYPPDGLPGVFNSFPKGY